MGEHEAPKVLKGRGKDEDYVLYREPLVTTFTDSDTLYNNNKSHTSPGAQQSPKYNYSLNENLLKTRWSEWIIYCKKTYIYNMMEKLRNTPENYLEETKEKNPLVPHPTSMIWRVDCSPVSERAETSRTIVMAEWV